jgi:porin
MAQTIIRPAAAALALALAALGPAARGQTTPPNATGEPSGPSNEASPSNHTDPASPASQSSSSGSAGPQPYFGPAPPNANNAPVGPRTAYALEQTGAERPEFVGPLRPLSNYLGQYGVSLRGVLIDQYANNPTGGVHQGNDNVGQLNFGADVDLQKALGIPGGSFHTTIYRDYGFSLAKDTTGTLVKEQNIYKNAYPKLHLGLFAYEQKLLDDRLDIIVGRLGTTAYYAHLIPDCNFQSGATCGVPTILNSESGFGLLPSATWGMNVTYHFSRSVYFTTGAFEVNPFIQHTDGLDWSTKYATGVTTPFELVWARPDLRREAYPFELKFGGYTSTAPHADPLYNAKGLSLGTYGGVARNDATRDGLYLMGDRVIWRPDRSSNRNLNLFGAYIQPLTDEETLRQQSFGGLLLTGTFPGRPYDTVGLMGSYMQLSPREVEFLDDSRIKAGGSGTAKRDEGVFELNYGVQVAPFVKLTPNVQYIVNPDNSQIPKITFVPKNAVILGLYLTIGVSQLLGFAGLGAGND